MNHRYPNEIFLPPCPLANRLTNPAYAIVPPFVTVVGLMLFAAKWKDWDFAQIDRKILSLIEQACTGKFPLHPEFHSPVLIRIPVPNE